MCYQLKIVLNILSKFFFKGNICNQIHVQNDCRLGFATQAKAAKDLANVRLRMQQDIEDNGGMENRTLGKIAAAFCRDDKSKEKLKKYEQSVSLLMKTHIL